MNFFFARLVLIICFSNLQAAERSCFYSQADQDQFVYTLLYRLQTKEDKGYYLEIGAGEPVAINNTYFFEKNLYWHGTSIDISDGLKTRWYKDRSNLLLIEDATQTDYTAVLQNFPEVIDYLSLDVDAHYTTVLKRIPFDRYLFKVITIEHDYYRYGDLYRTEERQILKELGYHLLCADVKSEGCIFEDWWIHPQAFPSDLFSALCSLDLQGQDHAEIIRLILAHLKRRENFLKPF